MKARLISLLICLAMLVSLCPLSVLAEERSRTFTDLFDGKKYSVQQGFYYSSGSVSSGKSSVAYLPYYYSDGYFEESPTTYNTHLSTMSLNLAIASTHGSYISTEYCHSALRQLLADIGCNEQSIRFDDSSLTTGTEMSIAFGLAQKELCYANGEETGYTLVPVVVRSMGYGLEWISNFTMGASGEAKGFAMAADEVFEGVNAYLKENCLTQRALDGKVKFWVAGYSRGAAIANLIARRLVDSFDTESVYAYTWGTPKGGVASAMEKDASAYNSIHNIVNYADLITMVAPAEMDFIRYGQDHVFPFADESCSSYADTEDVYTARKDLMLAQLQSIDAELAASFDDTFNVYSFDTSVKGLTISDILSLVDKFSGLDGGDYDTLRSSLIERGIITSHSYSASKYGTKNKYTGDYMQMLLNRLQVWCMTSHDKSAPNLSYRSQFSEHELYLAGGTPCDGSASVDTVLEQAIGELLALIFTKNSEDADVLLDRLTGILDQFTAAFDDGISIDSITEMWDTLSPLFNMLLYWNTPSTSSSTAIVVTGKLIPIALLSVPKINDSVRLSYINQYWELAEPALRNEYGNYDDIITEQEAALLHENWPTVFTLLMSLLSADYNTAASSYGYTPGGSGKTVMLATLLMNYKVILFNHDYPSALAWARSYDSYYDGNTPAAKGSVYSSISAPAATAAGTAISRDSGDPTLIRCNEKITLDVPDRAGETIFYTLKDSDGSVVTGYDNVLYQGDITLPQSESGDAAYTITATAWAYEHQSTSASYYVKSVPSCGIRTPDISENGMSYTVNCNYDYSGKVIIMAAAYLNGKLMDTAFSSPVLITDGKISGTLDIDFNDEYEYRLFVVTENGYEPFCPNWCSTTV